MGLWKRLFRKAKKPAAFICDRGMFHYRCPNGAAAVIDVFEADRRLRKHGDGDKWADAVTVMRSASLMLMHSTSEVAKAEALAEKRRAFDDLAALSRKVFDLPVGSDTGGWSDAEAFILFTDYVREIVTLGDEMLPLPKSLA